MAGFFSLRLCIRGFLMSPSALSLNIPRIFQEGAYDRCI